MWDRGTLHIKFVICFHPPSVLKWVECSGVVVLSETLDLDYTT